MVDARRSSLVRVVNDKGRRRKVPTYIASNEAIDESLKPYSWYKDHILTGGREHGLPQDYNDECVANVEAVEDAPVARVPRERMARSVIGQPNLCSYPRHAGGLQTYAGLN